MNAIPQPPQPEDRTTRHRRICQRLVELAMQLTEAAAARALQHLESETPQPQAETNPEDPAAQPRATRDPILTFVRLASAVRHAMAHEARIDAAEHAATAGKSGKTTYQFPAGEDLRGAVLAPIVRRAAQAQPNRPNLAEKAAEELETYLLIDLNGILSAGDILERVCTDVGLQPDYTILPPEILQALYPDGPPPPARIWRTAGEDW